MKNNNNQNMHALARRKIIRCIGTFNACNDINHNNDPPKPTDTIIDDNTNSAKRLVLLATATGTVQQLCSVPTSKNQHSR